MPLTRPSMEFSSSRPEEVFVRVMWRRVQCVNDELRHSRPNRLTGLLPGRHDFSAAHLVLLQFRRITDGKPRVSLNQRERLYLPGDVIALARIDRRVTAKGCKNTSDLIGGKRWNPPVLALPFVADGWQGSSDILGPEVRVEAVLPE